MKLIVAAVWGFLMGLLTVLVGPLTLASDNLVFAVMERYLFWLVVPGLVIGTTAGSFGLSIFVNAALHFSLCWLVLRVLFRERKSAEVNRDKAVR
jgi:uncharacterized membrane protein